MANAQTYRKNVAAVKRPKKPTAGDLVAAYRSVGKSTKGRKSGYSKGAKAY